MPTQLPIKIELYYSKNNLHLKNVCDRALFTTIALYTLNRLGVALVSKHYEIEIIIMGMMCTFKSDCNSLSVNLLA